MSVKIAERLQRVRPYGERRIPLGPGVVWFSNPDLGTGLCFPIQRLGYRVRLSGPAGAVEAFLTFTNPTAQAQTAYFLFPLDRGVTPVKIRGKVGDRQIETDVGPAPADDAEEENQLTVPPELSKLFQEETEDVLVIPLGSIPSGGEITFQMLLAYMVYEAGESGHGFSFRLPLMTSQALTTLKEADREQLTLASGLDRGAQVALSLQIEASDLEPGRIATSQVCGVARSPKGDLTVEYDRRKPLEPRDFVVDYQLWAGDRPKGWLRSQGRHFLLNFFPPANPTPSNPRRLVILLDGSEEMSRVGLKRCGGCLSFILKNLAPEDKFALVAFNREVSGYKNGDFVEAGLADEALEWLSTFQFSGGADLKELLRRVVTLPRKSDSVLSVVLVTAGRIGNEPELYRLLQGSRDILRLFPIMLGHRADPAFARAAARLTGGYAFRALTQESVSRAAERVLEHTRQPVLEGVGLQDKGLQYQGDSLTPKYPTGLNWRRPITVLGAHTGRGGLEAGGTAADGNGWSEFLELKPCFHKVLANVWAHVKSSELDDEAQMLDRSERSLLVKVILNLSREFKLLNRHTVPLIRSSDGQEVMAPPIEAARWYRRLERDILKGQSANELIEMQKAQKGIKGGISKGRDPGRGLTMKEVLGSKSTAAIFGSKLSARNKLAPSVKEGLFSKPMLSSKRDLSYRLSADSPTHQNNFGAPPGLPPTPKPISPRPEPEEAASRPPLDPPPPFDRPPAPPEMPRPVAPSVRPPEERPVTEPPRHEPEGAALDISERPTARLGPPRISPSRPPIINVESASDDISPADRPTHKLDVSAFRQSGPSEMPAIPRIVPSMPEESPSAVGLEERDEKPDLPVPRPDLETRERAKKQRDPEPPGGNREAAADETPPAPAPPAPQAAAPSPRSEEVNDARSLPTPRELAAQVRPEARQGKPEEVARHALRAEPQLRQSLMAEMRTLHGSLGAADQARILELTDAVLFRLAEVAPRAELLVRAYGLGYQARGMVTADLEEARSKLKFWLTRFAKLF